MNPAARNFKLGIAVLLATILAGCVNSSRAPGPTSVKPAATADTTSPEDLNTPRLIPDDERLAQPTWRDKLSDVDWERVARENILDY